MYRIQTVETPEFSEMSFWAHFKLKTKMKMRRFYIQPVSAPMGLPFGEFRTDIQCTDTIASSPYMDVVPCKHRPRSSLRVQYFIIHYTLSPIFSRVRVNVYRLFVVCSIPTCWSEEDEKRIILTQWHMWTSIWTGLISLVTTQLPFNSCGLSFLFPQILFSLAKILKSFHSESKILAHIWKYIFLNPNNKNLTKTDAVRWAYILKKIL